MASAMWTPLSEFSVPKVIVGIKIFKIILEMLIINEEIKINRIIN